MTQFAKLQPIPSLYAWIPANTIVAWDLAAFLLHLQTGGMAPEEPGPGGVGEDGIPLPGNPVAWNYSSLDLDQMKSYFIRQATRAQQPPVALVEQVLFELEFREVQRLPPAIAVLFVDAATILADPATGEADNALAGDILGIQSTETAPSVVRLFTSYPST